MSAGAANARGCRSGSLRLAVCGGSNEASATVATASRSRLLSRFATGLVTTGGAISSLAARTLSRPRMLVAAAPTMRKQVIAMMAMAFVQHLSAFFLGHLPENWAIIKA